MTPREVLCGGKANADGTQVHTPTKKAPRHTSDNGAAPEGTQKVTRARHVDRMASPVAKWDVLSAVQAYGDAVDARAVAKPEDQEYARNRVTAAYQRIYDLVDSMARGGAHV